MSTPFELNRFVIGSALRELKKIPDETFHCVVTSPPYWGLRDYQARGQYGLERTPQLYVRRLVSLFREVRRVLRKDGTLWLNLGDSYATGAGIAGDSPGGGAQGARWRGDADRLRDAKRGYRGERLVNGRGDQPAVQRKKTVGVGPMTQPNRMPVPGLKPKDLIGIPWRVAFALQLDGWWLRSEIIWAKPNTMPESVVDRPTKAHEQVFLLAKSRRYFYDAKAIAEPLTAPAAATADDAARAFSRRRATTVGPRQESASLSKPTPTSRNARDVWTIASEPFDGAHFATFPTELARRCILAGCPEGGAVLDCFFGSGTVGQVAEAHGRRWFGIELQRKYAPLIEQRTKHVGMIFREPPPPEPAMPPAQPDLFAAEASHG